MGGFEDVDDAGNFVKLVFNILLDIAVSLVVLYHQIFLLSHDLFCVCTLSSFFVANWHRNKLSKVVENRR